VERKDVRWGANENRGGGRGWGMGEMKRGKGRRWREVTLLAGVVIVGGGLVSS